MLRSQTEACELIQTIDPHCFFFHPVLTEQQTPCPKLEGPGLSSTPPLRQYREGKRQISAARTEMTGLQGQKESGPLHSC